MPVRRRGADGHACFRPAVNRAAPRSWSARCRHVDVEAVPEGVWLCVGDETARTDGDGRHASRSSRARPGLRARHVRDRPPRPSDLPRGVRAGRRTRRAALQRSRPDDGDRMTRKLLSACGWWSWAGRPGHGLAAKLDIGLVIDGSGSIDDADWQLQREGFATALRDPANVPLDGSIAIAVVQFSSGATEEVPRTVIDSQEALDKVVKKIESMEQRGSGTDPGRGVQAGSAPWASLRTDAKAVLCLSTDGTTNEGPALDSAVIGARTAGVRPLLRDRHRGLLRGGGRSARALRPARVRRWRGDDRPQHGRVRVADRRLVLRRGRDAPRARGQPGRAGLEELRAAAPAARDGRARVRRDGAGRAERARQRPADRPPRRRRAARQPARGHQRRRQRARPRGHRRPPRRDPRLAQLRAADLLDARGRARARVRRRRRARAVPRTPGPAAPRRTTAA